MVVGAQSLQARTNRWTGHTRTQLVAKQHPRFADTLRPATSITEIYQEPLKFRTSGQELFVLAKTRDHRSAELRLHVSKFSRLAQKHVKTYVNAKSGHVASWSWSNAHAYAYSGGFTWQMMVRTWVVQPQSTRVCRCKVVSLFFSFFFFFFRWEQCINNLKPSAKCVEQS